MMNIISDAENGGIEHSFLDNLEEGSVICPVVVSGQIFVKNKKTIDFSGEG